MDPIAERPSTSNTGEVRLWHGPPRVPKFPRHGGEKAAKNGGTMQAMRIDVLGSGTSLPHPTRRPPAFAVQQGKARVLIDAGSGCSGALAALGIGLDALSGIALTHQHPDHTAELLPMLFALHNPLGPRRAGDLPVWGPRGTVRLLTDLRDLYGDWIEPRGVAVIPHDVGAGQTVSVGDLSFTAHAVQHAGECFAYRVMAGGQVACFSGDTGYCPGIIDAARGANVLLCECAALEGEGARGHLSATEVGRVATEAGCRKVILTHLYQRVVDSDPLMRVRSYFDGEVQLAEDGMRVSL